MVTGYKKYKAKNIYLVLYYCKRSGLILSFTIRTKNMFSSLLELYLYTDYFDN